MKDIKIRINIEGRPVTVIEETVKDKFDDHALVDGVRGIVGELKGDD